MEKPNNLYVDTSVEGITAKYDASCKRILSDKYILAYIMQSCIPEFADSSINDIVHKYIEGVELGRGMSVDSTKGNTIVGRGTEDATRNEGTIKFDVCCDAIAPTTSGKGAVSLIINVEAQNDYSPKYNLLQRAVYYGSRLISSQKGRDWDASDYAKIRKVYTVWICLNPPAKHEDHINTYSLTETKLHGNVEQDIKKYNLLTIIMVGLTSKATQHRLINLLSAIFSTELTAEQKHSTLSAYDIPLTHIETEVQEMCNFSKGVLKKGLEEGRARGIVEGKAEGMAQGMAQMIKNLMNSTGKTFDEAVLILQVSPEDAETCRPLVFAE